MTTEQIIIVLTLFSVGVFFIYFGIRGLFGYQRRTYIFPLDYGYIAGLANYSSIPLGVATLMLVALMVLPLPELWADTCFLIFSLVTLIGILFGIFQPKFMTPQWYRWLEENHKDVMHLLYEDVRKMGYDVWRRRTDTQEGLEEWVAEVRRRHGFPEK